MASASPLGSLYWRISRIQGFRGDFGSSEKHRLQRPMNLRVRTVSNPYDSSDEDGNGDCANDQFEAPVTSQKRPKSFLRRSLLLNLPRTVLRPGNFHRNGSSLRLSGQKKNSLPYIETKSSLPLSGGPRNSSRYQTEADYFFAFLSEGFWVDVLQGVEPLPLRARQWPQVSLTQG